MYNADSGYSKTYEDFVANNGGLMKWTLLGGYDDFKHDRDINNLEY